MSVVSEQRGSFVLVEGVCVLRASPPGKNGGRGLSFNCILDLTLKRKKTAENLSQCRRKVLETHLCVDLVSCLEATSNGLLLPNAIFFRLLCSALVRDKRSENFRIWQLLPIQ